MAKKVTKKGGMSIVRAGGGAPPIIMTAPAAPAARKGSLRRFGGAARDAGKRNKGRLVQAGVAYLLGMAEARGFIPHSSPMTKLVAGAGLAIAGDSMKQPLVADAGAAVATIAAYQLGAEKTVKVMGETDGEYVDGSGEVVE